MEPFTASRRVLRSNGGGAGSADVAKALVAEICEGQLESDCKKKWQKCIDISADLSRLAHHSRSLRI